MEQQFTKEVDVLIFEDDHYYNDLLAKQLNDLNQNPKINQNFQVRIRQVFDPEHFLKEADPVLEKDKQTIAFIDYYLGSGITGTELSGKILELNETVKIIILSQSEEVIHRLRNAKPRNNMYTSLVKYEHTPEMCCIIVENYLKNL
jgi:two-component SAPR family response regulator